MINIKKIYYLIGLLIVFLIILFLFFINRNSSEYNSLSEIQEKGILVVGISPPYGIMEFYDENNNLVGIDVDIINEIASQLNLTLELKVIEFDNLLNALNTNEIDLAISALSVTSERNKGYLASSSYFNGGQTVLSSDANINYFVDLYSKTIGVEGSGPTELNTAILSYTERVKLIFYPETDEVKYLDKVITELNANKIDAFVVDYIAAIKLIKENSELIIVGTQFTQEDYVIYANLNNEELIKEVNGVLLEMKRNGELKLIENNWK